MVGFDQSSCLYVMKAVNTRDPVTQVPPIYLVTMLEYVILTGYDWWDIIAALKPGILQLCAFVKSDLSLKRRLSPPSGPFTPSESEKFL